MLRVRNTTRRDFDSFVNHLASIGHNGFDAMLATMHEVAEDGLEHMQNEASKRTAERTGRLLDSFTLGNRLCVYDVGEYDVVFGSALYYAGMVDAGHAIVPPGYRKDYRKQKRRKQENQRYDYYEGAHFFNPAFNKVENDFTRKMSQDLGLVVSNTSFAKRQAKRKKRRGSV
jgi:hypothetical protein